MHRSHHLYLPLAVVLIALAVAVPAYAGQPLCLGISDFTNCARGATQQSTSNSVALRRGIGDFLVSASSGKPSAATRANVTTSTAHGFAWTDAGIGAAVTLGAVVLAAGLALGVVLGRTQWRPLRGGAS
jgi:hypothetical protein